MRIAFLYKGNDPFVNRRVKYFLRRGHEVYYFALTPFGTQLPPEGTKIIPIKESFWRKMNFIPYAKWFSDLFIVPYLTKKYSIDILHVTNMAYAKHAIFSRSKKVVVENEGSDVIVLPMPKRKWKLRTYYRACYCFADAVIQDSKLAQRAGIRYGAPVDRNEVIEVGVDFTVFNQKVPKGLARFRLNSRKNKK